MLNFHVGRVWQCCKNVKLNFSDFFYDIRLSHNWEWPTLPGYDPSYFRDIVSPGDRLSRCADTGPSTPLSWGGGAGEGGAGLLGGGGAGELASGLGGGHRPGGGHSHSGALVKLEFKCFLVFWNLWDICQTIGICIDIKICLIFFLWSPFWSLNCLYLAYLAKCSLEIGQSLAISELVLRSAECGLDGGVDGSVQLAKDRVHEGGGVLLGRGSREGRAGKQRQTHKLGRREIFII